MGVTTNKAWLAEREDSEEDLRERGGTRTTSYTNLMFECQELLEKLLVPFVLLCGNLLRE